MQEMIREQENDCIDPDTNDESNWTIQSASSLMANNLIKEICCWLKRVNIYFSLIDQQQLLANKIIAE